MGPIGRLVALGRAVVLGPMAGLRPLDFSPTVETLGHPVSPFDFPAWRFVPTTRLSWLRGIHWPLGALELPAWVLDCTARLMAPRGLRLGRALWATWWHPLELEAPQHGEGPLAARRAASPRSEMPLGCPMGLLHSPAVLFWPTSWAFYRKAEPHGRPGGTPLTAWRLPVLIDV